MVGSSLYSFPLYVLRLYKRLHCQPYMLCLVGAPAISKHAAGRTQQCRHLQLVSSMQHAKCSNPAICI